MTARPYLLRAACGATSFLILAAVATAQPYADALRLQSPEPVSNGNFGNAVAPAGDIDGDGVPDFLVGASGEVTAGDDLGRAHVLSGADGATLLSLDPPGATEADHGQFGWAVSGVGDLDGDGTPDLLAGARAWTTSAYTAGAAFALSGADGSVLHTLVSPNAGEFGFFGQAVAAAGDLDGDGIPDFLVSADEQVNSTTRGRVYVYSGAAGAVLDVLRAADNMRLAQSIAPAGDVDGDGTPDFLASSSNGYGDAPSAAVLYSGATRAPLRTFATADLGTAAIDAVASVGDVTGDGVPDVAVGASRGTGTGSVYVFDGATGERRYTLSAGAASDDFGRTVVGVGDVNGDGTPDLAVGARTAAVVEGANGRVLVYEGATGAYLFDLVSPDASALVSGSLELFGTSIAAVGDVDGDGRTDLLVGASWEDDGLPTSAGRAYLFRSSSAADVAEIQLVHGSAALAPLGPVEVYLDGAAEPAAVVSYPNGTGFVALPAAEEVEVRVRLQNAPPPGLPREVTFTAPPLAPGRYVVTLAGIPEQLLAFYAANPEDRDRALQLVVAALGGPSASRSGGPVVAVAHAVTDAPSIDVVVAETGTVLADDLPFGMAAPPAALPPGTHTVEVRRSDDGALLEAVRFDLPDDAEAVQFTATGFLDPSRNQNGPAFAVVAVDETGEADAGVVVTDAEGGEGAPDALRLRAFPNPARDHVAIELTLPEAGDFRVEAFDVLGRRVAVLAEGPRGPGRHAIPVEVGALPGGLYVLRLVAGARTTAERLTITR